MPCGNGASSGLRLMKWRSGTRIFSARPGSVPAAGSKDFIFFMNENMDGSPQLRDR